MSIQFSDTTTFRGLVQQYEREIGVNRTDVSGDSDRLKEYTADSNDALDDFTAMAIQPSGTWQWDDSNHSDYPIITTNLVSGQRDYSFTTDENSNIILDIYKVLVADSSGVYHDTPPVDVQSQKDTVAFYDGQDVGGFPQSYDKTANGIFFDIIPNYSYANGLKIYINREASYFVDTDTTKKAGIPGLFHAYLYLKPAYIYARRNNLSSTERLFRDITVMEANIEEYFGNRSKDESPRLKVANHNNK